MHTVPQLPRLNLNGRQLYDLELLLCGGFAPLTGFMDEATYGRVCEEMRLKSGEVFPIPVVLDVEESAPYASGDRVELCDPFGNPLAILTVTSRYTPDKRQEALAVYGTDDEHHPGVQYLMREMAPVYLGGTLQKIALPRHADFAQLRHTPDELKQIFGERGWDRVIGFQTRNPMHRAHFELVRRAHEAVGAPVLVHPVVGMTKPGDVDYVTRVRTYVTICNTYGKDFTFLSLLPLAMRMAGPREALWHARIRKNYGCTHFIVGRDHAGPGADASGTPFYQPEAARELAFEYASEIGITIVPSEELAYAPARGAYIPVSELHTDEPVENISGTECRRRLATGEHIPEWFSFPECVSILREGARKDPRPGIALFFTGLSGAGKTTIATLLHTRLQEMQDREVTLLDGDIVREHLSKGLGFSKEDRDTNVERIGFVAGEVARHGGIAVCSQIAPYRQARRKARALVEAHGVFVEIFVATSLAECERRDTKGLYARARAGDIPQFTGVSDPYEAPERAEIVVDTLEKTPDAIVDEILAYLRERGYLSR